MVKVNFKEIAYKILYEKYKSMFEDIQHEARNKTEHGKDEDKIAFLSDVANLGKYSYCGLISKEDIQVIKTLEKCLGEHELTAE